MVPLVGGDHQGALGQGLSQNLRVHVFMFGRLLEGLGNFDRPPPTLAASWCTPWRKYYPNLNENETVRALKMVFWGEGPGSATLGSPPQHIFPKSLFAEPGQIR